MTRTLISTLVVLVVFFCGILSGYFYHHCPREKTYTGTVNVSNDIGETVSDLVAKRDSGEIYSTSIETNFLYLIYDMDTFKLNIPFKYNPDDSVFDTPAIMVVRDSNPVINLEDVKESSVGNIRIRHPYIGVSSK